MPSVRGDARSDAVRYVLSYLGGRGLEVGVGLLVGREGLLEDRGLDRPTLERVGELVLDRLMLDRDLEGLEGRLDRTEEELGLLDVRTRLLLRETLEPREELLPVTIEREVLDGDRDPTFELLDPLVLRDFEKRLPTLLRGIVVTRGPEVRLRLEEVTALPVCREGALALVSPRPDVLVLGELVAILRAELPVPVDVTLRAPRGDLKTLGSPDCALELAAERPARVRSS